MTTALTKNDCCDWLVELNGLLDAIEQLNAKIGAHATMGATQDGELGAALLRVREIVSTTVALAVKTSGIK